MPSPYLDGVFDKLTLDSGGKTHAYFDFNCLIHPCCQKVLKSLEI